MYIFEELRNKSFVCYRFQYINIFRKVTLINKLRNIILKKKSCILKNTLCFTITFLLIYRIKMYLCYI